MPDFTPDPRSCFVALLEDVPYEMFGGLISPYERRHLDCLQPEGVMTERRHGLAWLDRMRHRVAS